MKLEKILGIITKKREKILGIITKDVIVAEEDTSVLEIVHLMKDNDISTVVILKDNKVTGMVRERDIVRNLVAKSLSPEVTKARDIMTREVAKVDFREGLNKIYQTLCDIRFQHLLVMDDDKLVGITSRRDLLDSLVS